MNLVRCLDTPWIWEVLVITGALVVVHIILVILGTPVIREFLVITGALVVIHVVVAAGPAVGHGDGTWHLAAVHAPVMYCNVL